MSKMTERQFRKELVSAKSQISDGDVYTSPLFKTHLTRLANALVNRKTRKHLKVDFFWDLASEDIAFTDGSEIHLNGANDISLSLPSRKLKTLSYTGLIGHEVGHVLFSDFYALKQCMEYLQDKKFYPAVPTVTSVAHKKNLEEILFYFKDPKSMEITASVIAKTVGNINNAIEDAWMEEKMMERYPGDIKRGISLNAFRMMELTPSLQSMTDDNLAAFDIVFNLILQYVRCGTINNWEGLDNEYTEFIADIADMLDDAIVDDRINARLSTVNTIVVKMWQWLKEEIERIKKLPQMPQQSGSGSRKSSGGSKSNQKSDTGNAGGNQKSQSQPGGQKSSDSQSDSGAEKSASSDNDSTSDQKSDAGTADRKSKMPEPLTEQEQQALDELFNKMDKAAQSMGISKVPEGIKAPLIKFDANGQEQGNELTEAEASQSVENRKDFRKRVADEVQKCTEKEGGRFKTEGREAEFLDNLETFCEKDATDVGDINCLLKKMIEEQATSKVELDNEEKLKKDLETSLREADLTKLHNVPRTIKRMADVPDHLITEYKQIAPEVKKISVMLQKEMQHVLEQQDGYTERGLFIGKRMDKRLYRNDDRIFVKNHLPGDGLELAVALVIDRSGSMSSCYRIQKAKLAALVLYDFCTALDIPVAVYGHNVNERVNLYAYADFDSIDGKDRYRIMSLEPGGCNRDGLAYRYVGNRLEERPEMHKLLIMMSDGQPNDSGYGGAVARDDLYSAKCMFERRGIHTFAAAIGEDKDVIKTIYGNGFLNISEISKLPIQMVRLVQSFIR